MSEPSQGRPTSATVRQYVDGELPAAQAKMLEDELATDPALSRRVELERALHDRLKRVLRDECPEVPADLAERVRKRLAEAGPTRAADRAPRRSIASLLRGPQRANVFAVAASLALVGAAVLVGIFGTPIDDWRPRPVDLIGSAVPFVAGEHERCAGSAEVRSEKAVYRRPEEAGAQLSEWLGVRIRAVALTERLTQDGWGFMGGGRCGVPVADHSCHLLYARHDWESGPIMLSIFMVPDHGHYRVIEKDIEVAVTPGRWLSLRGFSRPVRVYSDGKLIYLLVACRPEGLDRAVTAVESVIAPR